MLHGMLEVLHSGKSKSPLMHPAQNKYIDLKNSNIKRPMAIFDKP